ncbi:hypothetical protein IW262DRAFT_1299918 [Armillaria fumosa]|nr:hypothetical protein IW262DRAFT_1299918 [Armillaria fumosa]
MDLDDFVILHRGGLGSDYGIIDKITVHTHSYPLSLPLTDMPKNTISTMPRTTSDGIGLPSMYTGSSVVVCSLDDEHAKDFACWQQHSSDEESITILDGAPATVEKHHCPGQQKVHAIWWIKQDNEDLIHTFIPLTNGNGLKLESHRPGTTVAIKGDAVSELKDWADWAATMG